MIMEDRILQKHLSEILGRDAAIYPVAPGRLQLAVPYYHADGDPMEIYALSGSEDGTVVLTDCAMTLMRLSYTETISDSLVDDIKKLVNQYGFDFEGGQISTKAPIGSLSSYIANFAMTISKVMGLSQLSKNRNVSKFKENVDAFIMQNLKKYNPQKDYVIDDQDDVKADYRLVNPTAKDIQLFIFPIINTSNAIEVWGTLQFCLNAKILFRSLVACENHSKLSNVALKRMANNSDSFLLYEDDFYANAEQKIERLTQIT
ncbi:MAG TPA: DUF1828 domain-containing protein [Clostridiaceae bacterium]|nr:DUF1828 domain-containing protein [Clostridiaceae bacterium]